MWPSSQLGADSRKKNDEIYNPVQVDLPQV